MQNNLPDLKKLQIIHYPAPILTQKAEPIVEVTPEIADLAERMLDLMIEATGVGLAAPQIGVPLRLVVMSISGKIQDAQVLINPEVSNCHGWSEMEEGCLSVPGVLTKIKRHSKCEVTATDLDGNEFTEQAEGLYARALQHEYDHIEGVTIAERMSTTAKIVHRRQLRKLADQYNKETKD